jgi:hypothetical protein
MKAVWKYPGQKSGLHTDTRNHQLIFKHFVDIMIFFHLQVIIRPVKQQVTFLNCRLFLFTYLFFFQNKRNLFFSIGGFKHCVKLGIHR